MSEQTTHADAAMDDAAVRILASQINMTLELFDALDEGIALYRRDGTVVTGNATARTMVGRTQAELRDAYFTIHLAPGDFAKVLGFYQTLLATELPVEFDANFIHADGTPVPVHVRLLPARYQGRMVGIYGIAQQTAP